MKKKMAIALAALLALSFALPLGALAVPGAPGDLTATVRVGSITLVWKDSTGDGAGFQIERKEGGGSWEHLTDVGSSTNIYLDKEVITGNKYTYRVRAFDDSLSPAAYSGYSNEASGTIAVVSAPSNLEAVAGESSITLSWTDNSSDEEGFIIIKASRYDIWGNPLSEGIRVGANVTSYVDNYVQPGELYTYEVMAYISGPAETGIPSLYSEPSNSVSASLDAVSGSLVNFQKIHTYVPGQFTDVKATSWYSGAVASAYEYGLMQGDSDTTFKPSGYITVAEVITVAARVHSIYSTGNAVSSALASIPWYTPFVNYATDNGIIPKGAFSSYTKPATRAEMAYIFSRSLPKIEFVPPTPPNIVKSLPDVKSGAPYYDEIFLLYRAGVLAGNDAQGTFRPNSNIIRAEAAAIITRAILPDTRSSGKSFG